MQFLNGERLTRTVKSDKPLFSPINRRLITLIRINSAAENGEPEATFTIEVPITYYLEETKTDDEYKRIAAENLNDFAAVIFELVLLLIS